ncbi:MAG: M14 family metallopeptidase [Syntrophothermus sp.]
MIRHLFVYGLLLLFFPCNAQKPDLQTYYEMSGEKKTPRYEETLNFCKILEKSSPMVHLQSFGKSPQGRDLPLVIVDKQGLTDPLSMRKNGKIILLVQACIHPGESEGKDAGLMLIRDLITKKVPNDLLDHVSLLFIPIFNVDGHERFGPYNRINQNGPEEMGWRVTANNLNLNRDFVKADAPEMREWLKMFSNWLPDFFIDVHTTDGADYQYSLTYHMENSPAVDEGIAGFGKAFMEEWTSSLTKKGILNFPYIEFRNWHDPKSGLEGGVTPPMLSQGYTSMRNRPGLLLETHMLKPYNIRVSASYQAILTTMEILGREHGQLREAIGIADQRVSSDDFLKKPFPLHFNIDNSDSTLVDFLGIAYEEVKSPITGETWFKYGNQKITYRLPYFNTVKAADLVTLPKAYIIPAEWSTVIERLKVHGIKMKYLKNDTTMHIRTYRLINPRWQEVSYEGHHVMRNIETEEITIDKYFPKGSAVVDVSQPAARIIIHMLEPKGNGSLVFWNFFDPVFEQKEYGEHYVLEPLAEKYLKERPEIRAEFEQKMKSDTSFAKNPNAILNWFYSKSPYRDQNMNVYPVGRIF